MNWTDIGKKLAALGLPLLGGALGGPGGALVGKGIASALGLSEGATAEQAAVAMGNLTGEQLIALRTLEADLAKEQLKSDTSIALAQIDANKVEGMQTGIFKGGWRPMAGWSAVFVGLVYPVVRALLPWILKVCGVQGVPDLPALDATEALTCLGGLLGLGAMRSSERKAGKA